MPRDPLAESDYEKCVKFCESLPNSEQVLHCIDGCRTVGFSTVSIKAVNQAVSLIPEFNAIKVREGEVLLHTDKKSGLQIFALFSKGSLLGYQAKSKNGINVHSDLLSIQQDKMKCFVRLEDGTLVEVPCPDVIIITHTNATY
jgi:hypothetical protein